MFRHNNERENQVDNKQIDKLENLELQGDEKARKVLEDVQELRNKLEELKAQSSQETKPQGKSADGADTARFTTSIDPAALKAAEEAVRRQAERDAADSVLAERKKIQEKAALIEEAKNREAEAIENVERKKREAEEKKRQLEEAAKKAEEMKAKREQAEIQANINRRARAAEHDEAVRKQKQEEKRLRDIEKKLEKEKEAELERQRKEAARLQKEREKKLREEAEKEKKAELERRRKEARAEAERLAAEEKRRAAERAAEKKRQEAERKQQEAERKRQEAERKRQETERRRQEAERKKAEERKRRAEREKLIAQQREIQRQQRERQKLQREEDAKHIKELEHVLEAKRKEQKRLRREAQDAEKSQKREVRRKKKLAEQSAELGGGLVSVHGTTVQTEIQPVPAFSLKDMLGFAKKKEIKEAATEEERIALEEEGKQIAAEARAAASELAELRRRRRANSPAVVRAKKILSFCDEKKKPLLIGFTALLTVIVGAAAVFNYCTAYEYSYSGQPLGYIKNKDDALKVTAIVQEALTEDKNVSIAIDARQDITFKRVFTINKDIVIDSSDDVLRRMTYLGDINVKAYGIYLDGKKVGAVNSKDDAAEVLQEIMDKYSSKKEGTVVEKAEVVEDIEVKKSNTPMRELMSVDDMVEKLCTDSEKETLYTVQRGQTLKMIAEDHGVTEKQLMKDNPNITNPEKLEVGSTVVIREMAPLMLVKITEKREYEKRTAYKTIKKEDKDLYEGYTEVDQKGKKGVSDVIERTVSINGEVTSTDILKNDVKSEPVDKIIRVGTKERPPTVGSGTYIWPAYPG
ncbi:MAG: G5 domain-containing protein, partial [Firmicutes bacterium]|nr:G5 domain-containing protein [Bacillota bacterium]